MSQSAIKSPKNPAHSRLVLYDEPHLIDLVSCRRRLPFRVAELMAEGKQGGGRELIAGAADVDVKTLRTFLDGGRVSEQSVIAIIERGLGLKFADVVKPAKVA